MEIPPLKYVKTFKDTKTHLNVDSGTVQHWCPIAIEETNAFELGVSRFTAGSTGRIHPEKKKYEKGWDFILMPSKGPIEITGENESYSLAQFDFVYVSSDTHHRVQNIGNEEAWAIWAAVPSTAERPSAIQYINTFEEIEAGTGADPEDIKQYWIPISEDTIGIRDLEMGLIFRPPGTEVPYHQHDPPETKEAFVSLKGLMGVQGPKQYYKIEEYDAMYVPPSGRHSNRNISHKELRYVFIETPAEPELDFI